jgi:hypothetical protein
VRERAVFRLAKPVPSDAEGTEAGDIGFIVDGAGYNQAEKGPLEARPSFQTEPQYKFWFRLTLFSNSRFSPTV